MKKKKLMCGDCYNEIFVDVNMVMLKDDIWKSICDADSDSYCDTCIEERLGRKIKKNDFKLFEGGMIICNSFWLWNKEH